MQIFVRSVRGPIIYNRSRLISLVLPFAINRRGIDYPSLRRMKIYRLRDTAWAKTKTKKYEGQISTGTGELFR